jgi:hypothetical protein
MKASENGSCQRCGVSFDGGSIWEHFYAEKMADTSDLALPEAEASVAAAQYATEVAAHYGATRERGQWGRQIGLSNGDSVRSWMCPDCGHIWPR